MIDSTTSSSGSTDSTASVTSTPSSAPAPSSTPDTSGSPLAKTWDEAFDRMEASGPSDPDAPSDAPTTPVPATTELGAEPIAPVAESSAPIDAKGAIPADRHKAILENTRRKTAEDVVAKVGQQFGPAIQLQQRLQSDPVGTLQQLFDEAMADPQMGPTLLSHAARTLSASRGRKADLEEPQPDLQTADGTLVYSADQLAKREAWNRAALMREFEAKTAPFQQDLVARSQEKALEAARQQTSQTVKTRLGQWRERPGFKEHEADIAVKQAAYVAEGHDSWNALAWAYTDVYHDKIVPKLHADNHTNLVRTAVAKAKASTDNPASVTPTPKKGLAPTWDEAFERFGLK